MIAKDSDRSAWPTPPAHSPGSPPVVPSGLPATPSIRRIAAVPARPFELLLIPTDAVASEGHAAEEPAGLEEARLWAVTGLSPASPAIDAAGTVPVTIPLYGCHVIWTPSRGAVLGPAARTEPLAAALADFAGREAELRDLELRGNELLETVEADSPAAFAAGEESLGHRPDLAARFREAVAVRRGLAALGPAVHVPPVHPPTLASQLGERLRDRTRLAERHELATDRADFTLQIYEACGQRVSDLAIARRQMGLEWVIIVILVSQLALMVVEMLSSRSGT